MSEWSLFPNGDKTETSITRPSLLQKQTSKQTNNIYIYIYINAYSFL